MWQCSCIPLHPFHPKTTWFDWKTVEVSLDPVKPAGVILTARREDFTQYMLTNSPEQSLLHWPCYSLLLQEMPASLECYCTTHQLILLSKFHLHQNAGWVLCQEQLWPQKTVTQRRWFCITSWGRLSLFSAHTWQICSHLRSVPSWKPSQVPWSASIGILCIKENDTQPAFRELHMFNECKLG